MSRLTILTLVFFVTSSIVACGDASEETVASTDQEAKTAEIDIHRLLEDEAILGGSNVRVADVQAVLDGRRSYLASYTEGGKSAASIIVERSRAYGVNPIYMLARIQTESALIESKTQKNLAKATGCACPDGQKCDGAASGFAAQVDCAAKLVKGYFTSLDTKGQTKTGWAVGKTKKTLEGCSVTPKNRATAALYTYTPWAGAYGKECKGKHGGSSLVVVLYRRYSTTAAPAMLAELPPALSEEEENEEGEEKLPPPSVEDEE
jgi:hypothetical protein